MTTSTRASDFSTAASCASAASTTTRRMSEFIRLSLTVIDARWMAVARGDEPADTVLAGGRVLSVFTKEWLHADLPILPRPVVGPRGYQSRGRSDVKGAYLV